MALSPPLGACRIWPRRRDLEAELGHKEALTWCGETQVGLGRALTSVLTVTG